MVKKIDAIPGQIVRGQKMSGPVRLAYNDIREAIDGNILLFEFEGDYGTKRLDAAAKKAAGIVLEEDTAKAVKKLKAEGKVPESFGGPSPKWPAWSECKKKETGRDLRKAAFVPYVYIVTRRVGDEYHVYCQIVPEELEQAILMEAQAQVEADD